MRPRPMIPGGVTEQVAREGGDALVGALSALLAGHPMNQVVYALTCSLGQVVMVAAETPAEAETAASVGRWEDRALSFSSVACRGGGRPGR